MPSGRLPAVALIVLISGLAFSAVRWWQGPVVEGYELELSSLQQTVVAAGRVVTESRTQISSELSGVVIERRVQEGDSVQPGDILLVLRADDLAAQVREAEAALLQLETTRRPQAAAELERAQSVLDQASREAQRRRTLTERALLEPEALEQALQQERVARTAVETARLTLNSLQPGQVEETVLRERLAALRAQLEKTTIRSAVAGTVLTRAVEPGDLVQPGRVLFTIAATGLTEVRAPLDERNLSLLALGQEAMIVADAYPEQPFPARITFISPAIDSARGTVEVRLAVDPVPEFLRQDMTVSVNIRTGSRERALTIPNDALGQIDGSHAQVLVVREDKVFPQQVTLGLRGLAHTEVASGLQAGEQVLADPSTALEEGARVRFQALPLQQHDRDPGASTRNELPVSLN